MKVMIVEDQTMIRSLLESYFRAEDRIPDHGVHSRRETSSRDVQDKFCRSDFDGCANREP